MITGALDVIEHFCGLGITVGLEALGNDLCQVSLLYEEVYLESVLVFFSVNESQILRDTFVEDESSDSGFDKLSRIVLVELS